MGGNALKQFGSTRLPIAEVYAFGGLSAASVDGGRHING